MPFCSKCGTEVPIEVSFCSKCGNKLQGEQSSTPTPPKVEVSTQNDETKPTLYNPIAIARLGLIHPLFGYIMFYLNFRILNNYKTTLYEKEKLSSSDLGSFAEVKSKRSGELKCICFGVASIIFAPFIFICAPVIGVSGPIVFKMPFFLLGLSMYITLFSLIKELKKEIMDIYGSEEYNKKPLLIPVVIMIAVPITFLIIALMLK